MVHKRYQQQYFTSHYLRIRYLFQRPVRPDSKDGLAVRRGGHRRVAARFQDALAFSFTGECVPFVDGTVHTAGDDLAVVGAPYDGADLCGGGSMVLLI